MIPVRARRLPIGYRRSSAIANFDRRLRTTEGSLAVATASTLVQRLRTVGSDLPSHLAAQIVELGHDAVPPLLRLLDDPGGKGSDAPDDNCAECGQVHDPAWARFHAVDLLTELHHPAAV